MTDIKVYSTPTCPWCMKLKSWMKEKGIKYTDIDVSADQHAAQEMIEKSGQMGVPQTEVNGKMIVGFNPEAIEAEIKKAKA
ncbi:glutathione S-transferase N-terminal domain-containing protein [Candidatus Woesearchaeota archaeon]|nr:glutathione S-transferase N-terminal domain-containing protein [Candidatus Woesearchaeota archaeon]